MNRKNRRAAKAAARKNRSPAIPPPRTWNQLGLVEQVQPRKGHARRGVSKVKPKAV